jgi:hypothetical protein
LLLLLLLLAIVFWRNIGVYDELLNSESNITISTI